MIEQGIKALVSRDSRDLRSLEEDFWRRECEVRASQRASRTLASLQAAVVALSVISSGAAGMVLASNRTEEQSASLFNPGTEMAPSSLLFGKHQ